MLNLHKAALYIFLMEECEWEIYAWNIVITNFWVNLRWNVVNYCLFCTKSSCKRYLNEFVLLTDKLTRDGVSSGTAYF